MIHDYYEREYMRIMMKRMGCLPIALLVIIMFLASCSTSKTSEVTEIIDTVTIRKVDTVNVYVEKIVNDTVKQVIEKTIIINEKGDTIREKTNNNYYQKTVEHDLTDIYKSRIDSLDEKLKQMQSKEKVIVKKQSPFERLRDYAIGAVVMLGVGFILKKTRR